MATPIERTNIQSSSLVDPVSRYRNQPVIYYGEKKLLAYETYVRNAYQPNGNERVMMITKGVEYRPDLVSFDVYGFPEAWWVILEANRMIDILDFKSGRTIILPSEVI